MLNCSLFQWFQDICFINFFFSFFDRANEDALREQKKKKMMKKKQRAKVKSCK